MTILQGLKKIKHLDRKIGKNRNRIARWCSHFSDEQPMYDNEGIRKLIQATDDLVHERNRIRHRLHETNILTTVELNGNVMTMDELIILRTLVVPEKLETLKTLRRKEKSHYQDKGITVLMHYDPAERDKAVDRLENALDEFDEILDDMNIKTDLVE